MDRTELVLNLSKVGVHLTGLAVALLLEIVVSMVHFVVALGSSRYVHQIISFCHLSPKSETFS